MLDACPEDDGELSPEEVRGLEEGREQMARGEVHDWEEVRRELG